MKTLFALIITVGILVSSPLLAAAAGGECSPYCADYPANAKSISCYCRMICSRLMCPPGTSAPTFIETKSCPPGPDTPAHDVDRICCTSSTGRTRCKAFPSCKAISRS